MWERECGRGSEGEGVREGVLEREEAKGHGQWLSFVSGCYL